jgi:outer membrane biosynthesis protein TonB
MADENATSGMAKASRASSFRRLRGVALFGSPSLVAVVAAVALIGQLQAAESDTPLTAAAVAATPGAGGTTEEPAGASADAAATASAVPAPAAVEPAPVGPAQPAPATPAGASTPARPAGGSSSGAPQGSPAPSPTPAPVQVPSPAPAPAPTPAPAPSPTPTPSPAPAPPAAAAPSPSPPTTPTPGNGQSGGSQPGNGGGWSASGPTARCRDGVLSFAPSPQVACWGHGGVAEWLR